MYVFNGEKSTKISTAIDRVFERTATSLYDIIDMKTASSAVGTFLNDTYYLTVPMKDTTGTVQNKLLTFDINDNVWNLHDIDTSFIFADQRNDILFGCMDHYSESGKYMVYDLLSAGSSSVDAPSPWFVTKSFDMRNIAEHSTETITTAAGFQAKGDRDIGFLREYRLDGKGTWTVEFFVDDVSVFSATHNGLTISDKSTWYNFNPQLKGRHMYVELTASGDDLQPTNCYINEIEVR